MLTRTRATAAAAAVALAVVFGAAPTALADGPDGGVSCGDYICEVEADDPGQAGSTGGHAGSEPQGGSGSGNGSNPWTCVYELLAPQPPAASLDWEGHTPGDGAVYEQTCHYLDSLNTVVRYQWLADPPPAATTTDPAVLAQRAVDSMKLAGPDIASPRAAGRYLVGMPMWMWVNQNPTTYGPNTASASAGGVTVTATAKVSKIVWTMGDGAVVTCAGPGTPYTAAAGKSDSPPADTPTPAPPPTKPEAATGSPRPPPGPSTGTSPPAAQDRQANSPKPARPKSRSLSRNSKSSTDTGRRRGPGALPPGTRSRLVSIDCAAWWANGVNRGGTPLLSPAVPQAAEPPRLPTPPQATRLSATNSRTAADPARLGARPCRSRGPGCIRAPACDPE